MPEHTQPRNWPCPRGPWHEVLDLSRLHDYGQPWCADVTGHPGPQRDYPDPETHQPWDECRTLSTSFLGARVDLGGPPLALELYAAAPYQFGALRDEAASVLPRIVLDCYSDPGTPEVAEMRFSLPLGEALRLARRITQMVDLVTMPPFVADR
jgi:hypothetical protein